jgi:serine/threonine protein kinase
MDPPAYLHCPTRITFHDNSRRYSATKVSRSRSGGSKPEVIYTKGLAKSISTGTSATETSSSTASTVRNPSCPVTGVNTDLFAHYRVMTDILGSGKYGDVRECFSRSSGRSFAVKSIDKSKISRFDHLNQEVVNLSKTNHGNIAKLVDCFEDASYLHIVTEKYTGGELFHKIINNRSDDGCLSEAKAARIIRSLLEAVAYLHSLDIVHRDIKPENIIFAHPGEDSDIKLIDFGLSRTHQETDVPMTNLVGTSYYMSPEVLKRNYDRATDVWSIGVVAYILLCGYPPFNGSNDEKIHESILAGKLRFNGKGWGDKSRDAKDFISCLLRRDCDRISIKQALNHPWIVKNSINIMEDMF